MVTISTLKKNDENIALLVGIGKWGETIARVLLRQNYKVSYVTRNNRRNIDFENKIGSKKLNHFSCNQIKFFHLVVIAVKPIDFYAAWSQYKIYSNKFLIEKPGALNREQIKLIFSEANSENKLVLINYEYIYTGESLLLSKRLEGKENSIQEISILWEKKLHIKGGLEWRILPHLVAELIILLNDDIYFQEKEITNQNIKIKGYFKNVNFLLEFNDNESFRYQNKVKLIDNQLYIKERNKLIYNNKIIYNQERLSVDHMIHLCKTSPNKFFMDNNKLSSDILKTIDDIHV